MQAPYEGQFIAIDPIKPIPKDKAEPFDCDVNRVRHAKETKGQQYNLTIQSSGSECCSSSEGDSCC